MILVDRWKRGWFKDGGYLWREGIGDVRTCLRSLVSISLLQDFNCCPWVTALLNSIGFSPRLLSYAV